MLFGLTFPDLNSKSLVSTRKIAALLLILLADCLLLMGIVPYKPSAGINLLTIVVILALVLTACRIPPNLKQVMTNRPTRSPLFFAVLGLFVLPFQILGGAMGANANSPPAEVIALEAFIALLLVLIVLRSIGSQGNEKQKLALAIGLITPIALFGFLASISLPLVILADLWLAIYLRGLWRYHRARVYEGGLQLPST